MLKGVEFNSFGAFFSRAYRENDYLWGRLHGAERMIDLVLSTLGDGDIAQTALSFKRRAFLAVVDEEQAAGRCTPALLDGIRQEIAARMGADGSAA